MEKLSIFLSHLTVESKLADILKRHLTHDFIGLVEVFVSSDRTSIPVGAKWLSDVTSALNRASIHIVLCSGESINRPWIHFEAGAAQIRGIPIVPICHSGLTPAQLPVPLSESEGIDAATAEGIAKLYSSIAEILGSDIPDVDFESYAEEIGTFETEYKANHAGAIAPSGVQTNTEVVQNPRVVCVSSQQFLKLGFENQLEIVLNAFPSEIAHERVFTAKALRELLGGERFDIVHVAAFVCPRTGDLYFSDVDLETGESTSAEADTITADALTSLLEMAKTKLVVITSCESLVLAATLVAATNVVATRDMVSPKMMAAWVESFYGMLPSQPIQQAFDYAVKASRAPMRYYGRHSIVFTVERETAHAF
jgi:hypothetical protein